MDKPAANMTMSSEMKEIQQYCVFMGLFIYIMRLFT